MTSSDCFDSEVRGRRRLRLRMISLRPARQTFCFVDSYSDLAIWASFQQVYSTNYLLIYCTFAALEDFQSEFASQTGVLHY